MSVKGIDNCGTFTTGSAPEMKYAPYNELRDKLFSYNRIIPLNGLGPAQPF